MARVSILYRNEPDYGDVAAADEVSTLPATFLQHPSLGNVWRTPTDVTSSAVTADLGASRAIGVVALLACNLSAAGTARVKLSDVDATSHELYDSTLLDPAGVDTIYQSFIHVLPSPVTARYIRVELADDSLDYLEAGRLVAGALWTPDYNYSWTDIERGAVDDSPRDLSISGEPWVESRPTRRRVRFSLPWVSATELATHLDAMGRIAGRKRDVLVILDHEASSVPQETYWGLMTDAPSVVGTGLRAFRQSIEVITQR